MKHLLEALAAITAVIIVVYLAVLVVGGLVNLYLNPLGVFAFIWDSTVVASFDLLRAAVARVFDYLAVILGAAVSVAALTAGIVINVRFISSQYYKLDIRLNRADQQNLALAFFLFSLPALLAVLYLVAERKEFTLRSLAAVFIGVFCIARALTVLDRPHIARVSQAICAFCAMVLVVAGLVWLHAHATWTRMPEVIVSLLTSAPGWESRLTFYAFGAMALTLAIVAPTLVRRESKVSAEMIGSSSQVA
jgi:hypothetical protein